MPEVQLVAHTIRSHGVAVARLHMHDWLILVLLVVVDLILNFIEPFHRFVGEGMMVDLRYPLKGNTVPFWAVPIIGILLPFIVILIYYFIRRDVYDLHQAVLGLLYSVGVTAVITDAIKDGVGRPRPDFFWRCFPDGKGVFDPVTRKVLCTGIKSVIKEGHKSFPSGHTSCKQSDLLQERVYVASLVVMLFILPFIRCIFYIPGDWSFAGLGFLAWYLSGKIRAFDHRGHVAKLCIAFLPILLAALVGVSRVDDYWHHWQDVFAGGLLGMTIASFCYLQFFPPPYDVDGWGPHAYFQTLRESQNGIQSSTTNVNSLNVLQSELTSACMRPQHGLGISEIGTGDSSPMLDALENGRRMEILN